MADKTQWVNLADWYTAAEATAALSRNAGRPIDKNYPRTLARYNRVRTMELGTRGRLYLKADIDGYVVSTKRGVKAKAKQAA